MAEQNNMNNAVRMAANTVKDAKALGRIAANAASGNAVGVAAEVIKNPDTIKRIIALIITINLLVVMCLVAVPSMAYSTIDSYITGVMDKWDEASHLTGNNIADFFLAPHVFVWSGVLDFVSNSAQVVFGDIGQEDELPITEDGLQVIALEESMQNEIKMMENKTLQRYEKRHERLLAEINSDANTRRWKYDYFSVIINDPLQSQQIQSDAYRIEAIKLMAAYTVQTGGQLGDRIKYSEYSNWLGAERLYLFDGKKTTLPGWNTKVSIWNGTFMSQPEYRRAAAAKEAGTYNKNDYDMTSILNHIIYHDPAGVQLTEWTETEAIYTDDGVEYVTYTYCTATYTIQTADVSSLADNAFQFQSGLVSLGEPAYEKEYYQELVETTCLYQGISYGGSFISSGGSAKTLLELAEAQLGKNAASDDMKFLKAAGLSYGDPWCAALVSWLGKELDYDTAGIFPVSGSSRIIWNFFYDKGTAYRLRSGYEPQPGDIVFFYWDGNSSSVSERNPTLSHVGIVYSYDNGKLITIEGNTSGSSNTTSVVAKRDRTSSIGNYQIYGYAHPDYPVDFQIPRVFRKYESGSPGFISTGAGDAGGKSYGITQFPTNGGIVNSFVSWLATYDNELYSALSGYTVGSESFDNAWKQLASTHASKFEAAQLQYSYDTDVKPFVDKIKANNGVDLTRSTALWEMAFARGIQQGPNLAYKHLSPYINSGMSDEEIIRSVYKALRDNVDSWWSGSSQQIRDNLRTIRFVNEENDLLALCK